MAGQRGAIDRDAVLAAARELLVAEGLDGVSFRRIAARLDVTAPALYAYVADKADLLRALADREFASLLERFTEVTDPDPIARIRRDARAYVQHAREQPALFHVMLVFRPGWVGASAEELPIASRVFGELFGAVEEAIAAGRIHGDPFTVALALWSAVHGVASVLVANPGLGDAADDALVDAAIEAMLVGFARPGGQV